MNGENSSLERGLGRVEARVSDLTGQITTMRSEFSQLAQAMEAEIAGHRERISALEAFRRWMIGLMTGLFLSSAAAVFAYVLKQN
jgi:hypothetical protein